MVGESVPPALVPRALALDTLTNSVTRMVGPIVAGTLYQFAGLAGAFALSAVDLSVRRDCSPPGCRTSRTSAGWC